MGMCRNPINTIRFLYFNIYYDFLEKLKILQTLSILTSIFFIIIYRTDFIIFTFMTHYNKLRFIFCSIVNFQDVSHIKRYIKIENIINYCK
jgi:hypothetical protein